MISLHYTSHTKAYNTIYTACNIVEAIYYFTVVSALAMINVVNRHWAQLLLGWVTASGQINCLGNVTLPRRSTQPSILCGMVK